MQTDLPGQCPKGSFVLPKGSKTYDKVSFFAIFGLVHCVLCLVYWCVRLAGHLLTISLYRLKVN